MDVQAIADALAAKFASGTLTPPTGYTAVRLATARPPNNLTAFPTVLVIPPDGEVQPQAGWVDYTLDFDVEFHYAQNTADKPRDFAAMLAWLPKLLAAVYSGWSLGITGLTAVKPQSWAYDVLPYGGQENYGWRIRFRAWFGEAQVMSA